MMRFDRFDFLVDIRDVYILPTIRIHFAVFHFRWRWVDGN